MLNIVQFMEAGDRAKSSLDYEEATKMYKQAIDIQSSQPIIEPSIKLGVCLCELARYAEA